jgi:hypothetical protein
MSNTWHREGEMEISLSKDDKISFEGPRKNKRRFKK